MSQEGRVVDYLGNNKFVIELPEEKESDGSPVVEQIKVAHDYVEIYGSSSFQMTPDENGKYPYQPKRGASNWVGSKASIQISIRDMIKVVLPFLNSHKYLQESHLEDRIHTEDDKYFKQYNLDKPRYLKGDKYPAYAYDAGAVRYYDEERGEVVVKFRRCGEANYETISLALFNQIRPTLKLYKSKYKLNK